MPHLLPCFLCFVLLFLFCLNSICSPTNYYRALYGIDDGLNMDRGGFAQLKFGCYLIFMFGHIAVLLRRDGTNCACVFDGVTSGGIVNLYAAQSFTQSTIRFLVENHEKFEAKTIRGLGERCFLEAVSQEHNPKHQNAAHDGEGGGATGVFVVVERRSSSVILHGAALGDCIAIYLDRRRGIATQLSYFARRNNSARDTGGQLNMCLGISGEVTSFSFPCEPDDFIVLTSDGLVDNIAHGHLDSVIPLIVCSVFFDEAPDSYCPTTRDGTNPRLPLPEDLESAIAGYPRQQLADVTCSVAATRLTNYVVWVTRFIYEVEQTYYGHKWNLHMLMKQNKSGSSPALKDEIDRILALMAEMEATKPHNVVKTDDTLVLVMTPCSI